MRRLVVMMACALMVQGPRLALGDTAASRRAREACIQGWTRYYESDLERARECWTRSLSLDSTVKDARRGLRRVREERLVITKEQPFRESILEFYDRGMTAYRRRAWKEAKGWLKKAWMLAQAHPRLRAAFRDVLGQLGEVLEEPKPPAPPAPPPSVSPAHEPAPPKPLVSPPPPRKKVVVVRPPRPSRGEIEALYRQGYKAYRQGKREEALRVWRLVLRADPKHSKARKNVKALERSLNTPRGTP